MFCLMLFWKFRRVAIETGSFHSHPAESYRSQLSALRPPPLAFEKNGVLFFPAFYTGRSVLFPQMPRAFHNGSVSWMHVLAWRLVTLGIPCRWICSNPMSHKGDLLEVLLIMSGNPQAWPKSGFWRMTSALNHVE